MKYSDYKKKKEQEEEKISKGESKATIYDSMGYSQYKQAQGFGLDTLESDIRNLGSQISNVYGGWQTPETMANTRASVEAMHSRLGKYQEYQKQYGGADLSDVLGGYQTVLDDWDERASVYGNYKNADAFNIARKQSQMETTFSGLTYDQVQAEKKKYKAGSDEYNFLDTYLGYTDLNEFDKALANVGDNKSYSKQLEEAKNRHALDNKFDYYKHYMDEEGFAEKSKYQSTINEDAKWWEQEIGDKTYEYINNVDGIRGELLDQHARNNTDSAITTLPSYAERNLDQMNEKEIAVYNYIYATEGKKAAEAYLTDLEVMLGKRASDKMKADINQAVDDNWLSAVGLSIASPVFNIGGGIYSGIDNVANLLTGQEANPYGKYQSVVNMGSDIRESVSDNIDGDAWSFLYNTGMSIADSALGAFSFGKAFTPIMGMTAAQQTQRDLIEKGASQEEVAATSLASGLFEAAFEYIGVDKLFKIKNTDSLRKILINAMKQAGAEGLEEVGTEVSNTFADWIIRQDSSEVTQMYNDLLESGYTETEAGFKMALNLGSRVGQALLGGVLSGGVMGGVFSGAQYAGFKKTGKEIRANDRVKELMKVGELMKNQGLTAEESEAYRAYSEYVNKGVNVDNITNAQLGNIYDTAMVEADDVYHSRKTTIKQKADALKRMDALSVTKTSKSEAELARKQRASQLHKADNTSLNGNEAKIEGIRKEEDGSTTVLTSQGEASVDDMNFSPTDAEIISYAENMSEEKANLMLAQYDGTTDVDDYVTSFNMAYSYGEIGFGADTVLKNKGVLTDAQASEIYKTAVTNEASRKQKVIDDLNAKYGKTVTVEGTFNDGVIDYNNASKDDTKVNWSSLTSTQRSAIRFMKAFSKVSGVNIKLIKSKIEDGTHTGHNGSYDPETNTIEIDVYAGRMDAKALNDAIIPTLSHELTHWMKAKSPAMYSKMREYISETITADGKTTVEDRVDAEMIRMKNKHPDDIITADMAIDEIIARTCEDMLSNSQTARELMSRLTEKEQKTLLKKIKETFKNLMDWVNELLGQYKSESPEAKLLREYQDRLNELSKMWDQAFAEAVQTNQNLQLEGITGEKLINGISKDGTTIEGENVLQMSERTYREGGKAYLENWLNKKVKDNFITREDADDIIRQTDAIYQIMQDLKNGNELPDYARWAEQDITTDENGKKISVIVKNGDYSMNLDIALVCKKRTALNAVLNALVQSNDLSVYTLTETDVSELNDIIKKHDFEIACALCFVDSKRYRVGSWANSFCEGTEDNNGKKYGFNEMVRSLVPKGSNLQIDEFNFTGRNIINQPTENLLSQADDSELDFTLIDQIMRDNPPAKNGAKSAQYRYAEAIKNNKNLRSILNPSEIISSIGLDAIRVEHTTLYGLINGHQGTAKPKFAHQAVAFMNDILRASSWNADKARMVGGVRLQSFSDFMANMVFDYVQMVSEMAAKKLPAHAYTKEPLFVKLFGLTGIKINMSLVPKVDLTKEQIKRFRDMTDEEKENDPEYQRMAENAGLRINENGEAEYIWEDETFPYDVAMDIMADPRYTKNCGTICVGISDKHIRKLLADDRISMVIPYHKSGLNHMVALMRNIALYKNYTNVQNTRYASGEKLDTKKHKDFDFYGDLYGKGNKKGTHDPKQTAENYKAWCEKKGYLPKFDEFAKDPNYYKLLIDFTVYDINDNMKYTEQEAVKAIYPSEAEFKDLILNGVKKNGVTYGGLKQSQETSDRLDKETQQIVDEFRARLTEKYGKDVLVKQHSDRDDQVYMDAVNRGDMETAQKMVDEVARQHGFTERVSHGTQKFGFTSIDVSKSDDKLSFFATSDIDTSRTYSSVNGKRRITGDADYDGLDEIIEQHERKSMDMAYDLAEKISAWAGYYGFADGDYIHETFLEKARTLSSEDADREMYEFVVDIIADGYSEDAYGGQEFWEWQESEEADELFTKVNETILSYIYLAEFEKDAESSGNYDLYANTDGFLVVEGNGANWDGIKSDVLPDINSEEYKKYGYRGHWNSWTTRSISKYANDNGYRGVLFKNIIDDGGKGTERIAKPSNVYSFFYPQEQVKSADPVTYDDNGNVIPLSQRFNTENADIRYSDRDSYAPTFYSHMDRVIGDIKQDKMSAGSVVNYLKGKGVKDEEIKWSGIETFLDGKKSVTKEELKEFSAGSMLQIEEETLSQESLLHLEQTMHKYFKFFDMTDYAYSDGTIETDALLDFVEESYDDGAITEEQRDELIIAINNASTESGTRWHEYKTEGGTNYRELLFYMPNSTFDNPAMNTHWGREGVLAHARMQDMETSDGQKMLFVEEIQSDWHNEGQKFGYRPKQDSIAEYNAKLFKYIKDSVDKEFGVGTYEKAYEMPFEMLTAKEMVAVEEFVEKAEREFKAENPKPPRHVALYQAEDAPFKKNYHEYVMKRLLRMAAEEGYDSIGWTTAKMQEDRWSSEFAEGYRIEYDQDIPKFLRKYGKKWGAEVGKTSLPYGDAEGYNTPDGGMYYSRTIAIANLVESVKGKEFAEEILLYPTLISTKKDGNVITVTEKDGTEIGKIIYGKRTRQIWSMNITESMKQSVLHEGQVMYSERVNYQDIESVASINSEEEVSTYNLDGKWNDYIGVQKRVIPVLENEGYFKIGPITNAKSGMVIRISKKGIKETLGKDNRFQSLPRKFKVYKVATIRSLPKLIETGYMIADNVDNNYDEDGYKYAYFKNKVVIDGEEVGVRISVKKKVDSNHFWIHNIDEYKNDTELLGPSQETEIKRLNVIDGSVAQNDEGVNLKFSDRNNLTRSEANKLAKAKVDSYKESIERKARIESITEKALILNNWMRKNSKDNHVPEAMKPIVAHLIQAIDFSSKRLLGMTGGQRKGEPTQKDISLKRALLEVQQMMSEAKVDDTILYELYGQDLSEDMKELVKQADLYASTIGDNEYILNKMTAHELLQLDKMVGAIKTTVTKMNKFHVAHTKQGIAYTAQQDIQYMNSIGQIKVPKGKFAKNLKQMLNWGNTTPFFAFKRFGEGGEKVFEALMDGWDKFSFNISKIIDYADETYTEAQVKQWSKEVHEFDVLLPATDTELADPNFKGNKQTIHLTTAQIMSLYCLQKREQAKGHILGGGIRITDIETNKGVISQSDGVVLSKKELVRIIGTLDADQIKVADALQKFMNEECTVWGNEISMKRFGYKAFGEKNYFPIRSDENVTGEADPKEQEKTLYRLLNMSFTKALTDKANNRIVVDNIFDVFANHTSEMAKYNALALPVLDATRWFNYREKGKQVDTHFETITLKGAMEKAYGKDAENYVRTFLQDINGTENVGRDRIAKGFMSSAKIASVGFNLKVVALQPTSFLRASAVIDNKYLAKALTRKPKMELAEKWCGMAQWKGLGFIDINVQRGVADLIKHDESVKDKITEASMKGAEIADKVTMGYLWNACEYEVRDKHPELKIGSDEYYQMVGKRLRNLIYQTQVVDSTMTRSHMMRSPDTKDKILTNFASEPTLAYNMLMDVYYDFKLTERQTGSKSRAFNKHGKKLARTMYAYTITNVITAALELGFELFRDDEEKEPEEVMKMYVENLYSNMSVLSKIPYFKEAISILQGFTSSNMDTQWMQYFAYSIKGIGKLLEGEGNAYTTLKNAIKGLSYLSGLPIYNILRDPVSLYEKFTEEELEEMFNDTIGTVYPSQKIK